MLGHIALPGRHAAAIGFGPIRHEFTAVAKVVEGRPQPPRIRELTAVQDRLRVHDAILVVAIAAAGARLAGPAHWTNGLLHQDVLVQSRYFRL